MMVKVLVYSNPRHILAFSSTASYSNLDTLSQVCSQALQQHFNFRRTERLVPRTALKHRAAANMATTSSSKLGYVDVPLFLSTCTFEHLYIWILVFLHSLFIFIIHALRIKMSCYPFSYVCDHSKSVQERPSNIYYKINALQVTKSFIVFSLISCPTTLRTIATT